MLRLTSSDGAIYEDSDPLHVVFNETSVIASTVLEWVTPPLSQRYLEACAQFKCGRRTNMTICRMRLKKT